MNRRPIHPRYVDAFQWRPGRWVGDSGLLFRAEHATPGVRMSQIRDAIRATDEALTRAMRK